MRKQISEHAAAKEIINDKKYDDWWEERRKNRKIFNEYCAEYLKKIS